MAEPDDADRRIAKLERDLAELQAEATYHQIEANLVRERLKSTLDMALTVVGRLTSGFEASMQRMADDLNGGVKR